MLGPKRHKKVLNPYKKENYPVKLLFSPHSYISSVIYSYYYLLGQYFLITNILTLLICIMRNHGIKQAVNWTHFKIISLKRNLTVYSDSSVRQATKPARRIPTVRSRYSIRALDFTGTFLFTLLCFDLLNLPGDRSFIDWISEETINILSLSISEDFETLLNGCFLLAFFWRPRVPNLTVWRSEVLDLVVGVKDSSELWEDLGLLSNFSFFWSWVVTIRCDNLNSDLFVPSGKIFTLCRSLGPSEFKDISSFSW